MVRDDDDDDNLVRKYGAFCLEHQVKADKDEEDND
jgi:hypothetical protein